jgi:hypothetical protein
MKDEEQEQSLLEYRKGAWNTSEWAVFSAVALALSTVLSRGRNRRRLAAQPPCAMRPAPTSKQRFGLA